MDIVNLLLDTESLEVNKQNNAGYTAVMLASLTQVDALESTFSFQRPFRVVCCIVRVQHLKHK